MVVVAARGAFAGKRGEVELLLLLADEGDELQTTHTPHSLPTLVASFEIQMQWDISRLSNWKHNNKLDVLIVGDSSAIQIARRAFKC